MSIIRFIALFLLLATVASATRKNNRASRRFRARVARRRPMMECRGNATYRVTLYNFLSRSNRAFSSIVPENGLVFSPVVGVTHSPRVSLLVLRGFASPPVEEVCETGDNTALLAAARSSDQVSSVVGGSGPIAAGGNYTFEVEANCGYPYLTVVSMIAPSPDWIVAIANMPLLSRGRFIRRRVGRLRPYDCGTDSGGNFTDPMDPSLDVPTEPPLNIAPLVEDDTNPFGRRAVGMYRVQRIM